MSTTLPPNVTSYDPRAWGARCDACPLNRAKPAWAVPVWASGARTGFRPDGTVGPALAPGVVALAVVEDAPGPLEVQRRLLFSGTAGNGLDDMLRAAGLQRTQVALLTAACLCRPEVPGLEGKKRFEVKTFMAWHRKENARIKKEHRAKVKAIRKAAPEHRAGLQAEAQADLALLKDDPFTCCAPRLQAELAWLEDAVRADPDVRSVVVPAGPFALGSLMDVPGKSVSIQKYRGSVIEEG